MATFSDADFIEIPMEYVTTPRSGSLCVLDQWWITRNGNPVVYVRSGMKSKQRNRNRQVLENMLPAYPEGYTIVHIPACYDDHDCNDFV